MKCNEICCAQISHLFAKISSFSSCVRTESIASACIKQLDSHICRPSFCFHFKQCADPGSRIQHGSSLFPWIRICLVSNGTRSGSTDPCRWWMDPDLDLRILSLSVFSATIQKMFLQENGRNSLIKIKTFKLRLKNSN